MPGGGDACKLEGAGKIGICGTTMRENFFLVAPDLQSRMKSDLSHEVLISSERAVGIATRLGERLLDRLRLRVRPRRRHVRQPCLRIQDRQSRRVGSLRRAARRLSDHGHASRERHVRRHRESSETEDTPAQRQLRPRRQGD